MNSIPKYIYKLLSLLLKVDFLNKAIYITVGAFLAELAALGFRDGVIELISEFKLQPFVKGWIYWVVRIVEVTLVSGNWIIISILSFLLIVLVILRYTTSKKVATSKHLFNSQLRLIESFVRDFKSTTSLTLLKKFIEDVDDSYIKRSEQRVLKSKAHYLMGITKIDDDDEKFTFKSLIECYALDPSELKHMERACVSYYFMEDKESALSIANKVLSKDKGNERANAIKLINDPSFTFENIPEQTKKGRVFKRLYLNKLFKQGEKGEKEARLFVAEELSNRPVPSQIDFENIDYWEMIGRFAFYLGTHQQPNIFSSGKESYAANEMIQYANKLFSMIYPVVKDKEVFRNYKAYQLTAFYYFQTEYLIKETPEAVTEMSKLYLASFQNEKNSESLVLAVLTCLNQLGRYTEVIKITKEISDEKDFKHVLEFHAYNKLGKKEEALASSLKYLKYIKVVHDLEVNNLIGIANFLAQHNEDRETFYSTNILGLNFEQDFDREIVFCYYHRYVPHKQVEIEGKIDLIKNSYAGIRPELQGVALLILFSQNKFELTIQFIEQFHDWRTEQPAIFIYTESLLRLRNDSTRLLEVLKYRRDHFPHDSLLIEEIGIYELIENSEEVHAISIVGRKLFPGNPNFEFYYIFSAYKLRKPELFELLNDNLFDINFSWKQKLIIARVCIENKKKVLGLELFYREAVNTTNPIVKQSYFVLTTQISDREDIPWPKKVEIDTWAKINSENEQVLIHVTKETIKDNWVAGAIVGLSVGEEKQLEAPLTHKRVKLTILQVFDKFSGLTAKISDEIGKSDFTGMGIQSFKIDTSSHEGISKTLIEAFGESGDKEKIRRDEAFSKYYAGELSFTELVRSVSSDKVLEVYSYLTSSQSDGFQVIPIRDFNDVPINAKSEFVIDFTTLPILKFLSENNKGILKHKFIISQFAIELLENELADANLMQDEGMTVQITSFGVRPSLHPPGYKANRIKALEDILNWIRNNCETRQSKEKLDMILQHPDIVRESDIYYNYFIDTVFISFGRTLISDDRIHNKNFKHHYLTVSLEYYLNYFNKEELNKVILPALIQNHYIGIRLNQEAIRTEFKRPFFSGADPFLYCLENLPFSVNHDMTVFNEVLDFIKFIYSESMPLSYKKETSQKVLVHALKNYPNPFGLKKNLTNEIQARFRLLQLHLPEVLDDFIVAFDILFKSRQ